MEMLTGMLSGNTAASCVAFTIALANFVTAIMPSVKGHEVYDTVMRVLNWLSLNVGKNRNSDDPVQEMKK